MGWLIDNMNALENYQNNAMAKARQEREDAYQNEQRDRLRMKQADEDKSNAVFDTEAEAAMARIGSTPEKLDVRKMYKLPSATPPAPGIDGNPITPANPTAYPIPQGSEPAPVAAPPVAQPVANVPVTRSYVDDAEDSLKSQARLFKAKRDAAGFQSAINSFNKVRQGREDAAISAFVMNGASPEDMMQLASNITLDKQNGFKAAYDPVTKITRYELGEVKADLTRPELARILVAQNRIAKGDPSALDDIAKVHQGLAAKIKDDLKLTYEVTQANNKIGIDLGNLDNKREMTAIRAEAAANSAHNAQQRLAMQQELGKLKEKPIGPKISKMKNDSGGEYLYDENSGAVGELTPATPEVKGASHWFSPNEPDIPAMPAKAIWATADGRPLPKGPQSLYSQLPVNKQGAATSPMSGLMAGLQQAMKNGDLSGAIKELQGKGLPDVAIQELVGKLNK